MASFSFQNRISQAALSSTTGAAQGVSAVAFSAARSKARGRSGPSNDVQPVRWVAVMKEGGRSEETLLRHLALERALGHVGVGLARVAALRASQRDPVFPAHDRILNVPARHAASNT